MGEQQCESGIGAALDEQAGDSVSPGGPGKERLEALLLPVAVLPVGPIQQIQRKFTIGGIVRLQIIARFRGQECQLGRNPARTGRTTEQTTQLTKA